MPSPEQVKQKPAPKETEARPELERLFGKDVVVKFVEKLGLSSGIGTLKSIASLVKENYPESVADDSDVGFEMKVRAEIGKRIPEKEQAGFLSIFTNPKAKREKLINELESDVHYGILANKETIERYVEGRKGKDKKNEFFAEARVE